MKPTEFLPLPENRIRSLKCLDRIIGRRVFCFAGLIEKDNGGFIPSHIHRIEPWVAGPIVMGGDWASRPQPAANAYLTDMNDVISQSGNVRILPLHPYNCVTRTKTEFAFNAIFETEEEAEKWGLALKLAYYEEHHEFVERMSRRSLYEALPSMTIEYSTIAPRVYQWMKENTEGF